MSLKAKELNNFEIKSIMSNLKEYDVFHIEQNMNMDFGTSYIFFFNYQGFSLSCNITLVNDLIPEDTKDIDKFLGYARSNIKYLKREFDVKANFDKIIDPNDIVERRQDIINDISMLYRNLSSCKLLCRTLMASRISKFENNIHSSLSQGTPFKEVYLENLSKICFNKEAEILNNSYSLCI